MRRDILGMNFLQQPQRENEWVLMKILVMCNLGIKRGKDFLFLLFWQQL